jgi:hypothetical protein
MLYERLAAPREIVDVLFKEPPILEQSVARCVHAMPEKRTCIQKSRPLKIEQSRHLSRRGSRTSRLGSYGGTGIVAVGHILHASRLML